MDLDEVAHYEPPHQELRCLQIQLFSSLVLKEFTRLFLMNFSVLKSNESICQLRGILFTLVLDNYCYQYYHHYFNYYYY